MYFNKDNPQWKFSENQYLTDEEYYQLTDDYNALTREMLHVDFRDINEKFYGVKEQYSSSEEKERKRKLGLIYGIIGIAGFIGLVLLLIFKQLVIFGYCASALLIIIGITVIVTGRGEVLESSSKAIFNRLMGIGMTLGGIIIGILMIIRTRFSEAEFFILLFVAVFGIAGLALLLITVLRLCSGKIIYTGEVTAECIGYVRCVNSEEGSNQTRHVFIMTSPLFRYNFEGVQYEAIYDEFVAKRDADIALGQSVSINVDPKHPENIKSPSMTHAGGSAFMIFMAVACIAVAVGMGIYVAAGSAKDMTVETEWNPMIDKLNGDEKVSLTKISDDMIQKTYVDKEYPSQEWYYEVATVAGNEITKDGVRVSFDDDSFCYVITTDSTGKKPGDKCMLFYVIDREYLDYGKGYKIIFATGDPEVFQYTGSHGAYEG